MTTPAAALHLAGSGSETAAELRPRPAAPRVLEVGALMLGVWALAATVIALVPRQTFTFSPAAFADVSITPVPRHEVFLQALIPYAWWLVLTPLVVLLLRRLPPTPPHALRNLVLLAAAGALLALLHSLHVYVLSYASRSGFTFGPERGTGFVQHLPASFFGFWVTAGVATALSLWRQSRHREREAMRHAMRASHLEAQLARAGLDALRMQLNPHFLFNTLHTIASTTDVDPAAARAMTIRLAELLRLTLERSHRAEVTLQEELDWLEQYLEILQGRFEERLSVEMRIDPAALGMMVPALLLQPIVENALTHGAGSMDGMVRIDISAVCADGMLRLAVADRGPGFATAMKPHDSTGIGIGNTRQRLLTQYGGAHEFTLKNRAGGGAEVLIGLPATAASGHHAVSTASSHG